MKGEKLKRLTFSQTLAEHICATLHDGHAIKEFRYQSGRRLAPGEKSESGLYGIASNFKKKKGVVLRVSMKQEAAQQMTQDECQYLTEVWLM